MRLLLAIAVLLALSASAQAASFREPKLKTCAHSVEHTTSGKQAVLRRGYPNHLTFYARTVRLTILRDTMGRAVQVTVERADCYTIGRDAKMLVYRDPKRMTFAIDAFCREVYTPDSTVEIRQDETIHRLPLSEFLDGRRVLSPCFLQEHRVFTWCHNAHELVVERKR